jgi:hypothetical protein
VDVDEEILCHGGTRCQEKECSCGYSFANRHA